MSYNQNLMVFPVAPGRRVFPFLHKRIFSAVTAFAIAFFPLCAHAVSLIRDAEVEHTLRTFGEPIFSAANLEPQNVRIFIVNDDAINAYVAGGQNIFVHTGLIEAAQNPGMLLGVLAHETGHIAGGHLARGAEKMRNAQLGAIIGYVLGGAAAAAGGGEAGAAIMSGSQHVMMRNLLSFTRGQEQAADQAGLGFLDTLHYSAEGMLEMFETLRRNEALHVGTIDPYAITHPLSAERIQHVRAHVEKMPATDTPYPKAYNELHQRMRAKLYAFLELPPKTFARYPQSDRSVAARMARAIAWYKMPEVDKAVEEMNKLIAEKPKDAFLYDLKGQILFENRRAKEALEAYTNAASLAPDSPLILVSLAETQVNMNDPSLLAPALANVQKATALDASNPSAWRITATIQGKLGRQGEAQLALAEGAMLEGKPDTALQQAQAAQKQLKDGTPASLRADDIIRQAQQMKQAKKDAESVF